MKTLEVAAKAISSLKNQQVDAELLGGLWEADYEHRPVGPKEFIQSDEFLGKRAEELHDLWIEELDYVFGYGSDVTEWLIGGAAGTGKTTSASIGMLYSIYRFCCLRNPWNRYRLLPNSRIIFGIFNITLTRSDQAFELIRSWADQSPWFTKNCPRNKRRSTELIFPSKNVHVVQGSLAEHVLGENVFGMMLDEANFFKKQPGRTVTSSDKTKANEIYLKVKSREMQRFTKFGCTPGVNILISSEQEETSFIQQREAKAKTDPTIKVTRFALWETRKAEDVSGQRFPVIIGNGQISSKVLEVDEVPPPNVEVIEVPVEFRVPFEEDCDAAIRDIAGRPVTGKGKYFSSREYLYRCVDPKRVHPFDRESLVNIAVKNVDARIFDHLKVEQLFRVNRGHHILRVDPGVLRVAHCDIGLTGDPLGIAVGHLVPEIETLYYDLLLEVIPPKNDEIDLDSIVMFFRDLREHGMVFKSISYDQFQSKHSIQHLTKQGFAAAKVSADVNAYAALRRRAYGGPASCSYYLHRPAMKEMLDLEKSDDPQGCPDHPIGGHNDVTDAMAVVAMLLSGQTVLSSRPKRPGKASQRVRIASRMPLFG